MLRRARAISDEKSLNYIIFLEEIFNLVATCRRNHGNSSRPAAWFQSLNFEFRSSKRSRDGLLISNFRLKNNFAARTTESAKSTGTTGDSAKLVESKSA